MVIYLDIIFGLNVLFNFFLLLLTSYLIKSAKRPSRLLFGAVFASMIVPLQLYIIQPFFHSMLFEGFYALMIILATFGYNGFYSLMKRISIFILVTITAGGGLLSIQYLAREQWNTENRWLLLLNNADGDQISFVLMLGCLPFVLIFLKGNMDRHVKEKLKTDQIHTVYLEFDGIGKETAGYIDSGNQLSDPLTNKPVVICDEVFLKRFFSEEEWEKVVFGIKHNLFDHLPEKIEKRLCIVPYQGVGGEGGILYTFKPDKLTVYYENSILETKNVLIGIQIGSLTAGNHYHCLLHPELIQLKMSQTA